MLNNRFSATHFTSWIYQFDRVHQMTAAVALITARILVLASGTHALHESVGEESIAGLAMQLLHGLVQYVTLRLDFQEK